MSANASNRRQSSSIGSLGSESPWIRTKTLTGNRPRYGAISRPSEKYVDDEKREVIFYWQDDDNASWQISICSLLDDGACKWENITDTLRFNFRGTSFSETRPLPTHSGAASALWKFGESRIILLLGGEEHEGSPESSTRHLTSIDIDKRVWWHEDAMQWENLSPRYYPSMAITKNHIYLFGGLGIDATGRRLIPMKSFAVATFEIMTNRWRWVVLDQVFPDHVPDLGYLGDVIPVDGQKKILLTPGLIGKAEKINFSRDIVLFDTENHTFEVVKITPGIRLPKGIRLYGLYLLHNQPPPSNIPGLQAEAPMIESGLEADSVTPSNVLFATWGASGDIPEFWRLSLQSAEFQCLYLQKHLEVLNVSTRVFVVIDKRLFLLGTRSIEDVQSYFDVAVEIAL